MVRPSMMALRRRKTIWQSKAMAVIALSALTLSTQALAGGGRRFGDGYYVDAKVLRVEPILRVVRVAAPREVCWEESVRRTGRHRWRRHRPRRHYAIVELHCEIQTEYHNEERIDGYNVTYRYRGRHFTTRMKRDPGRRIRVRVRVEPAVEHERVSRAGKEYRSRDFICDDDCFDS